MENWIEVDEWLKDEDAQFGAEAFQDPEDVKEFVDKLRAQGVKEIQLPMDGDRQSGELYFLIPQDFSAQLAVEIAEQHPDECSIESIVAEHGQSEDDYIRLWWD